MSCEILVVVSDLHCGSSVGLMPPDAELSSGNTVGFGSNIHQEWLWDCWQKMTTEVLRIVGERKAALLVNGDATEGVHHGTTEVIAALIEDHTAMAIQCLSPISERCESVFVTKGTECHTRGMEDFLALKLKAVGGIAQSKHLIEIHGTLIDATHHMPTTGRGYLEAGAFSITMGNARLNAARCGHRVPRVFLRGHRHCGGWFSDHHGALGVTGGWQFLTRHGFKVVPDAIPVPTALILDWSGRPKDSLPMHHVIQFVPEQDAISKV